MMRHCPEFREFRQVQADQRRQEEYAKQGQIVADAISAKMGEAIKAVQKSVAKADSTAADSKSEL